MKDRSQPTTDIPRQFLVRMAGMLGDEFQPFLSSLQLPPITGLRVNTLKVTPTEFTQRSPFNLIPVPWCSSGFTADSDNESPELPTPGKHPYHTAGLYYLQEPSAMAAAEVLAPRPGDVVLDLAAAPGGKATHLAALLQNTGLLVANEIHGKRVWDLAENLERCGVTNAIVTNETPTRLAEHFGAYFDRVLLDAPCSGEGMFRKGDVARQEWRPELVRSCAIRQADILEQAAKLVKPGGHLAYTTCTFSIEENEAVIAGLLSRHPEFSLVPIPAEKGFKPARPEWIGFPASSDLQRAIRIWPHLSQGEGHFIALLVKQTESRSIPDEQTRNTSQKSNKRLIHTTIPKSARTLFDDFCQAYLNYPFEGSRLIQDGSYIYQVPIGLPNLAGLKVIRPGWWLGVLDKGRFTPSHSLALGLKSIHARLTLLLRAGDPQLFSYLRGESIPSVGPDGWVLVCVEAYPLGWGKRSQNMLKNFYPHGLRWKV